MSAVKWFCILGHLVWFSASEDLPACFEPERCPICGDTNFTKVQESCCPNFWGKPISYEVRRLRIPQAVDAKGNPIEAYIERKVPIYDISGMQGTLIN